MELLFSSFFLFFPLPSFSKFGNGLMKIKEDFSKECKVCCIWIISLFFLDLWSSFYGIPLESGKWWTLQEDGNMQDMCQVKKRVSGLHPWFGIRSSDSSPRWSAKESWSGSLWLARKHCWERVSAQTPDGKTWSRRRNSIWEIRTDSSYFRPCTLTSVL